MKRPVLFEIDRFSTVSLVDQLVASLRQAIGSGYYKPGDVLPTRKEFADALGVSERIPREAIARLVDAGLVYTRKCLGSVVSEKGERRWRGNVVFVETYDYSYYFQKLLVGFRAAMLDAGYLVTSVTCPTWHGGKTDVSVLRDALRQLVNFVVIPVLNPAIISEVESARVPYLIAADARDRTEMCREVFVVGRDDALRRFLSHCAESNVRTVVQVGIKHDHAALDLRRMRMPAGVSLKSWFIEPVKCRGALEDVSYGAMRAFRDRLSRDREWLPDVFFFLDDFVATGALMAMTSAGLHIPEDVKVVTLSNRGNCPVYPRALTRIEIDPFGNGEALASRVLAQLWPSRFRRGKEIGYKYVRGRTF